VRIGIVVSCWQNPRGFGHFSRELVRQLVDDDAATHEFILLIREVDLRGAQDHCVRTRTE